MADIVKSLRNLIKVSRQKVEDKQREVALVRQKIDALHLRIAGFEEKITSELAAAEIDTTLHDMAIRYMNKARQEIQRIKEEELPPLEKEEYKLQDGLAELFAEQKRYEILLDKKLEEIKRRQARRQQDLLDEMGADRHRRGNNQ